MSVRQAIVDAVAALLATITQANGYGTDAGRRVREHPNAPHTQLPAYLFRDTSASVEAGAEIGRFEHALNVEITGLAEGAEPTALARTLMKDVCTALRADPTLNGTCHRVRIVSHAIESEAAEKKFAAGTLTIAAVYRTPAHTL